MQSAKEAAANIAASAQSGLDKTKAVVQEKVEKMSASNPTEKQLITERKQQKIQDAEITKQATYQQNAAMSHAPHALNTVGGPGPYSSTIGATGQPLGQVVEGNAQPNPVGTTATGTERPTTGVDTHLGGGTGVGYGTTGGGYSS